MGVREVRSGEANVLSAGDGHVEAPSPMTSGAGGAVAAATRGPTRRRLLASGAAALGVTPLAACAVPGSGSGDAAAPPSKGPVSLFWFHAWAPAVFGVIEELLRDFTARHPTITAEHKRVNGNSTTIQEEVAALLAAGSPPDVTMFWRSHVPALAAKGGLVGLDPYMQRDRFDKTVYYESELRSSQFRGQTYVLPSAASGAWYILVYGAEAFRDAAIDAQKPPETWDEALRYAAQLTTRGADGQIARLGFEAGWRTADLFTAPFTAYLYANGGTFASDDGKQLRFDSPQGIGVLDWLGQLLRQQGGAAAYEEYRRRTMSNRPALYNGSLAIRLDNHSFMTATAAQARDYRYGIGQLPRGSPQGARGIVRGGWSNAVPTGVKSPHESWLLTHYLSATKEGAGRFIIAQGRPSPLKAVNEDPALTGLPNWDTIKRALSSDVVVAQTPVDPEVDKLVAQAVVGSVFEGTSPRDALQFAQTQGQRLVDEFWATIK
jgi:ABC-type glycerol-3-phosphate transport system substrate-binding protein